MGAVKLTKNDLKIQKDRLRQFERYLPTLRLKKQQLQAVIMKSAAELERAEKRYAETVDGLDDWVAVFAENATFAEDFKIERLVVPDKVVCGRENIAGVFVPVFKELTFRDAKDADIKRENANIDGDTAMRTTTWTTTRCGWTRRSCACGRYPPATRCSKR